MWSCTLTRTELLGFPSRPLRWLSLLTPMAFPSSSQPSSSSQNDSRSRKRRKLTATPNASIAIDSDMPMPDAPRSSPPAPTVLFIILARPTDDRTPHAPKVATPKPSPAAAPPPPHCPNCGDDHDAFSRECRARLVPPPQLEAPPPSNEELSDAFSDSEEAMDVGDDGHPAPSTPEASSTQNINLSTPRPLQQTRDAPAPPSGSQPAPTGQGRPPVTPSKPAGPSRK